VLNASQRRDNAERRELERRYHMLTQREREVLQGVVGGCINKVIAGIEREHPHRGDPSCIRHGEDAGRFPLESGPHGDGVKSPPARL